MITLKLMTLPILFAFGTAMNTGDALDAAEARNNHLETLMRDKKCPTNVQPEPLPPEIAKKYQKTS